MNSIRGNGSCLLESAIDAPASRSRMRRPPAPNPERSRSQDIPRQEHERDVVDPRERHADEQSQHDRSSDSVTTHLGQTLPRIRHEALTFQPSIHLDGSFDAA